MFRKPVTSKEIVTEKDPIDASAFISYLSDRINETDDIENGLTDSENQHNTTFDNFDARKNKTFSNQLKSGNKQSVRYNINLRDTSSLA